MCLKILTSAWSTGSEDPNWPWETLSSRKTFYLSFQETSRSMLWRSFFFLSVSQMTACSAFFVVCSYPRKLYRTRPRLHHSLTLTCYQIVDWCHPIFSSKLMRYISSLFWPPFAFLLLLSLRRGQGLHSLCSAGYSFDVLW